MASPNTTLHLFSIQGRVAIITGGGGMLGYEHAATIAGLGGHPVLLDIDEKGLSSNAQRLRSEFQAEIVTLKTDITNTEAVEDSKHAVLSKHGRIDILINNAARNPKIEASPEADFSRLEKFPADQWRDDLNVGLGGAFNCAKVYGTHMANAGGGVIVNIASDLGVIAPDQRIYYVDGRPEHLQPVKPVTYSVVKHGIIGLTKYLATYWANKAVRCNALSPGGVYAGQEEVFVKRVSSLIPLGRMANVDEYRGAIAFLCSDASSYLTGANIIVDGGRSVW